MKPASASRVKSDQGRATQRLHVADARSLHPEEDGGELDLGELLDTLVAGRWIIAAATALLMAVGVVYAVIATPVYRADALVQVEEKSGGMADLRDVSAMFTGETPAETELEIIRSRSVLGAVVDQVHLDIVAEPRYFPVVGQALARRHRVLNEVAPPLLGMGRFAWGGEHIRVERLDVPRLLEEEELTLVAGEAGHYTLLDPDEHVLLRGEVGKTAGSARADAPPQPGTEQVNIFVAELHARPGTQFLLMKLPRTTAIAAFQERLKVAERGKKTGILELKLDGPDENRITAALDRVTEVYVRQNVERKSEEAEKTLEFITAQLPELKANLDAAEAALNAHRAEHGSVDLSLEAQAIIQQAADTEKQLTALELQRAELRQRFTESHPTLIALQRKIDQIRAERASIEGRLKGRPQTELTSLRLQRDVKVANELYLLLLNKAQELRVVKSGTIGNVRILDPAVVQVKPVSPKRGLAVAACLFLGVAVGVGLVFLKRVLHQGVEDPDLLEQTLGLPVYASLPHSEKQAQMVQAAERGRKGALRPLALTEPSDLAVESLRSLRTSLQFALAEANNNVLVVGGPRPGVGKSFISVNLAHVLADSGKRVVLVDADMRKGQLHRYFGLERVAGLSELIRGSAQLDASLRPTDVSNLSFITTGTVPPNPSELLASTRFQQLVEELKARFDLVVLDAPPILAVTDAALIAQQAGVSLLVVKSGLHPMREVQVAVGRLEQNGARPNGFVFNDVPARSTVSGKGRYGYHYQYEYK